MSDRAAIPSILIALPLLASALHHASNAQQLPLMDRDVGNPAHWYQGTGEPGLYPGGLNLPSGTHLVYGQGQTAAIEPLPSATVSTSAPAIGVVAVGMSNTNQEWGRFSWRQAAGALHHPRVVTVDAGLGGYDAPDMDEATDPYWTWFDQRVAAAGLGLDQVQVVWLKQSLQGGGSPWPTGAQTLQQDLAEIVAVLVGRCPNLRVVYLASRIWGANEPWNFETAFAVKGVISDQVAAIAGGTADGPWLAWGPYLWADGLTPRSDGLSWDPNLHLEPDLTHPSLAGEEQVADLLEVFFTTDALASTWYLPPPGAAPLVRAATADAFVTDIAPLSNFGLGPTLLWAAGVHIYLRFDLAGLPAGGVERARLSLRVGPDDAISPGFLHLANSVTWDEATITFADAPGPGTLLRIVPATSRGGIIDLDVTPTVQAALAASDPAISFVLLPPITAVGTADYVSREGGEAPQLILSGPAIFGDGFESGDPAAWSAASGL